MPKHDFLTQPWNSIKTRRYSEHYIQADSRWGRRGDRWVAYGLAFAFGALAGLASVGAL